MFELTGKRILVTGASSGLGNHFARTLAGAGAEVIVAARRKDALDGLVAEIVGGRGLARAVPLDVTDMGSIAAALDMAGDIDVLVNNAGVTNTKAVLEQTEADFDFILDTNLKGGFLVATEVARRMKNRGAAGSIVNIASILGLRQGGQVTPYAISKAAVIQMTKQLGLELARFNIRVNAIAPGYVATELNDAFFQSEAGKALIKRVPQRRLGNLSDLDGPLVLLASDASLYMTGSIITVDGGHLVGSL
ncbi:NAD(P)-dependent dehydrogenase, short-chain alcohol dehydrogenase family [Sphingobium faniae]|nr:NAD(P)-dependent dehydrogenase, short-chain alcohol dehydrogenase family [Sphingobium faniae]